MHREKVKPWPKTQFAYLHITKIKSMLSEMSIAYTALDKREYQENTCIFFSYFSMKTYDVGTH